MGRTAAAPPRRDRQWLRGPQRHDQGEYGDRTHVEVDDVTDRAEAMRKRREERLKKESGG
jgi:hypothetical protein